MRPQDSHTGQQQQERQQEQQQLAVVVCDEHDMGEQNLLEEAGGARATTAGVGVNQHQHHEVDEIVDRLLPVRNPDTELEEVPPSEVDAPTTARSRESASSGIAQGRPQQIKLHASTARGGGEGVGSRREHCMEPSPTAMETPSGLPGDAGSSDEKRSEQGGDTSALNGDSGSGVINDVSSCVGTLKGGRQGSGAADSTGAFPSEPGLSTELQQPRAASLDCNDPRDRGSRRAEAPAGILAPPPGEPVSDLNSCSSSERRRVIQKQDISPPDGEQEEEVERVVVTRLTHHAEERDVARGKSGDGGNEKGRARDAEDSTREEGLTTPGNGRKGGSRNNDDNDLCSADEASFVKDDNLSGSDDEFGRGVAKHIGNQQQNRGKQRHRPSQSPNEEQSGGRSGSTGSSGSNGSGKDTDDTPPSKSSRAIDPHHTRVCT